MAQHSILKILLISFAFGVYIFMVAMNAGAGAGSMKGTFTQVVGNISAKYNTDFTPAGWTFFLWSVIYIWQFLWFGYVLAGFCRRSELGWMYLKPDVLPVSFYIVWILNNVLNIGWLFLWDREYLIPSLIFLAAIACTNYIVLIISYRSLFRHGNWFQRHQKVDLWLIRILVQNGIAVYATWTTIATLLNFTVVLVYNGGYTNSTSTTVSLSLLAFDLCLWFLLENFLFDKYVRYTITVYPVVIVALSGALDKNFNRSDPDYNAIFIAVLLAVACVLFLVRLVLVVWRHLKRPLYESTFSNKTSLAV
ncbi:uncharacterized protein O3C94_005299 isoform 1-T4 [Discoglossus pictus]